MGTAVVSIHGVRTYSNGFGIKAEDRTNQMAVRDSFINNNLNSGVQAQSASAVVSVNVDNCHISNNGLTNAAAAGIKAKGAAATINISENLITGNPNATALKISGVRATMYSRSPAPRSRTSVWSRARAAG